MNHTWMIFARLINGWGTGILNAIVPVWATETAEHKSRGQFVAIEFTLNIFGVVVAYWLEYACSFYKGGNGSFVWRFPIAFQIVPLLFLFGIVWLFPESPRWLVKVGREEEGRYILGRLRGETGEDLGRAEAEFQDIRNIAELERKTASRTSYWSMFTGSGSGKLHIGRRVQLVIWLQIMQEWIGIAGVTIYAPTIFRTAGISQTDVQWISGLNTITYMVSLVTHSIMQTWLISCSVVDPHLRLHSRSHRSPMDSLLGFSGARYLHGACRWSHHRWSIPS